MLLLVWRPQDPGRRDEVWSRLSRWAERNATTRVETRSWLAAAGSPPQLIHDGEDRVLLREFTFDHPYASEIGPYVTASATAETAVAGPFPQRPLYYYRSPDTGLFAACSKLEPLAAALPRRELYLPRLAAMMAWLHGDDPAATPFKELRRARPCDRIEATPEGLVVRVEVPRIGHRYRQGETGPLSRELRSRIEGAVERSAGDARSVGVCAGGGLDSSGILALAVQRNRAANRGQVAAFSLDFGAPGDDRPYMSALSDALGTLPVRLKPSEGAPFFSEGFCVDAQPGFVSSDCFWPVFGLAAKRHGVECLLSGVQGDTLFGPIHGPAMLVRKGRVLKGCTSAIRLRLQWPATWRERLRDLVLLPTVRGLAPRQVRHLARALRGRGTVPWLSKDAFEMVLRAHQVAQPDGPPMSPDALLEWRCRSSVTADRIDALGQAASHSLPVPFDVYGDPALVRFATEIDPLLLNCGNEFRGLYREAMRGVLPDVVRTRRDKASFEPAVAEAALAGDGLKTMKDLSSVSGLCSLGLIDMTKFRPEADACLAAVGRGMKAGDDLLEGRWEPFWRTLSIEAFVRRWGRVEPQSSTGGHPC